VLAEGGCVGEISILTDGAATANVDAVRDSNVIKLTKAAFNRIVSTNPVVLENVNRLLIERIKQRHRQNASSHRSRSFALVPAGPEVQLTEFAHGLSRSLQSFGDTLIVSSDTIDEALGAGSAQADDGGEVQRNVVS